MIRPFLKSVDSAHHSKAIVFCRQLKFFRGKIVSSDKMALEWRNVSWDCFVNRSCFLLTADSGQTADDSVINPGGSITTTHLFRKILKMRRWDPLSESLLALHRYLHNTIGMVEAETDKLLWSFAKSMLPKVRKSKALDLTFRVLSFSSTRKTFASCSAYYYQVTQVPYFLSHPNHHERNNIYITWWY